LVTEDKQIFYREIREIMIQNGIILIVSSVILLSLLLVFSIYLARPLERVVKAMRDITTQNDFSKQVEVEYPDEIGRVAHQFNIMTKDLDKAYSQVKDFAVKEVIARRRVAQREYETLNVLGKAAEYRDPETKSHIIRVGLYSKLLAKSLGENTESQDLIYYAAPLHDIGKLGIADSILLKPGKLSYDEFEIIKTHTYIAFEILVNTQSIFLRAGATIALTHHEKFDGNGYPKALKGENIPIYGRIVGLVDVFDALTSRRPYKDPWPFEKAIEHLVNEKGKHFDPIVVNHFVENLDEVRNILKTHPDDVQ
jgi:response regulator RpfG family c-di-GMP phosphodiesterase